VGPARPPPRPPPGPRGWWPGPGPPGRSGAAAGPALRRLTGGGDLWISETVIRYADGKVLHGANVIEFRDGKIWKETRYYAEPFEAPAWRAQWVERIEEPVAS
jgi:hypothetical protein